MSEPKPRRRCKLTLKTTELEILLGLEENSILSIEFNVDTGNIVIYSSDERYAYDVPVGYLIPDVLGQITTVPVFKLLKFKSK